MKKIAWALLVIIAVITRTHGLLWDQGQHLHPDERFLVMVTNAVALPTSLNQYLNTSISPLNPHNAGFSFFVYGTFPLKLVKYLAVNLHQDDYYQTLVLGRQVSALFDIGTVILVYLSARLLFKRKLFAFLSALFYTLSVLPIQLAHFYAVDSFLVFFITLSFYFLLRFNPIALGLSLALAVSCKITAVLFIPIIVLGFLFRYLQNRKFKHIFKAGIIFIFSFYISLRLAQPNLFANPSFFNIQPNPKVLENWKQLNSWNNVYFPPAVQWLNIPKNTYILENNLLWGLGLPLGLLSIVSLIYLLTKIRRYPIYSVPVLWTILLFVYQSLQFSQPLRYFAPIYPFLAMISGLFVGNFVISRNKYLALIILFLSLVYPLSFMSIYSHTHSRVAASSWINQNIPPGSRIYCEGWDDCLPLSSQNYQIITFSIYPLPDSFEKWIDLKNKLAKIDFIILSSNRLYGSITSASSYYPLTSKFYADLFNGSLGFSKITEFTSRPNLPIPGFKLCLTPPGIRYGKVAFPSQECPLPGISFVDDYADETFTVYDHPKVIIFKRN